MIKKAFIIAIIFSALIFPQKSKLKLINPMSSLPAFYFDFFNHKNPDTSLTALDVYAQIPFNKIHFYKETDGFRGEYTITVSVYDTGKTTLLQERIKNETVRVAQFEGTQSTRNFNISFVSFNLTPRTYTIVTVLEDKDSKQTYTVEHLVKVADFLQKVAMSDVFIISPYKSGTPNKIIPNISRVITTKQSSLPVYFEIYSDSVRKALMTFKVFSDEDTLKYRTVTLQNLLPGKNTVAYNLDSLVIPYGEYTISITLFDTNSSPLASVKKGFSMWAANLPYYVRDIDKAIEQMRYIATVSEMDTLQSKRSYDDKVHAFYDYWKKKDPNPATEENEFLLEYYRRVEYANRNFSHYVDGWKTDMGMVYIYMGTPNNIERHPFEIDSKPYEVWEYYELNLDVVFMDNTGFGDYRLITQLPAEAYRFR